MLRTVRPWQHVLVGLSILVMMLLAGFGVLGAGDEAVWRPEHFDAKQVTVWPDGADGVRIREVVDIDFGLAPRRGYQRIVPNDFGQPTAVTASSPDANDDLGVVPIGGETRIRIGDPNTTFTGRHRYVLEYTLPWANVSSGVLALDIIGTDETFETERFEVVLTGFDFDGVDCDTGSYGSLGGCEFTRDETGNFVTVIEPLAPGDGITVGGRFTTTTEPRLPEPPAQPEPVRVGFRPLGLLMIPLGVGAAAIVFVAGRRYGANTVLAGGATEAAFGELPVPGEGARPADVATYRVPDSRLADLATIEFAPPRGLEPWQAAVVLRERVDDETVLAWFSEMVALEAIVVEGSGKNVTLRRGTNSPRLTSVDMGHLTRLFASGDTVELGEYDPVFTGTWNAIARSQREFAKAAGWWSRGGPAPGLPATRVLLSITLSIVVALLALGGFVLAAAFGTSTWRLLASPWIAIVAGILVPFVVALLAYRRMFASRTATGSALALRSESFRRFLASSEGRHVEWAWSHGLLREYSAWAVALGAASAWSAAIRSSNIPDPTSALAGPLVMHTSHSAFQAAHTAPSSSGGGGGGGGVGGGGGGGSSGSW